MRRVLQVLSSHTQRVPYVGNFSLQIALPMSNKDSLPCLKRHKAVAKMAVARTTNWSGLFLPALVAGSLPSHLSLWASPLSVSLPPLSLSYPSPIAGGNWTQEEGLLAKHKMSQGRGLQETKKDFSVTTVMLLNHSINPSHAAHFFLLCSLELLPFGVRVCQRVDSVPDLGNVNAEWP